MSRGQVVFVSRNGAMLVVQSDEGFMLVEMLGDEGQIERGDLVYGDWTAVAGEPIRRAGETFDAFFQGCWGNYRIPLQMARNMGGG